MPLFDTSVVYGIVFNVPSHSRPVAGEGERSAAACSPRVTLRDWARGEFRRQAGDVMRALKTCRRPLTGEQAAELAAEIAALRPRWEAIAIESAAAPNQARYLARRISAKVAADLNEILLEARAGAYSMGELRGRLEARFQEWDTSGAEAIASGETLRAIGEEGGNEVSDRNAGEPR